MLKVLDGVKNKRRVLKNAQKLGLDQIDGDRQYRLKKNESKKFSTNGYPDSFEVMVGKAQLVGLDDKVWLAFFGHGQFFDWFKTSPIVSCYNAGFAFIVETENSLYVLEQI